MDVISQEKRLQTENKKLNREIKRLKKDNEVLRIANDQASRTQAYIQKDSMRQLFYNNQLLKTYPYLLILTDEQLLTVMSSDVLFRYICRYDREEIRRGVPIQNVLTGVLPKYDLSILLEKCGEALAGAAVPPYLMRSVISGKRVDWRITIKRMEKDDGSLAGLNIMFVDMTDVVNAMERAEEADKAKGNFLANMSHEIRTPMNAIVGMAEFILRDSADENARRHAVRIKSASRTLLAIINDILDFSKIESGKMDLVNDSYQLDHLIADLASIVNARLQSKPVTFKTDVDGNIPNLLYGDEVRLKQVLINLLGNAMKFTHSGSITLGINYEKIDNDHCRILFRVADTGIGIKPDDLKNIFSSFTQVDTKRNRAVEGTGLGLAICRQLVKMMGGSLRVESEYGKGTTFFFDVVSKVEGKQKLSETTETDNAESAGTAFHATFCAPEARALVVDDNEMNLEVAEGILAPYRISVVRAMSGPEALKIFAANTFDIIFMDHMMPDMDGVEAMRRMRLMKGGEEAVVIALTANALSGAAAEYKMLGFQGFLAKPIEPKSMEKILQNCLPARLIRPLTEKQNEMPVPKKTAPPTEIILSDAIDEKVALKYCMGNRAFLSKMLAAFCKNDKTKQLEAFYRTQDWDNYRILAHSLKGNARTIGALQFSEHAKELEFAARDERTGEIMEKHAPFLAEYRAILDAIKNPERKDA